MNADLTVYSPTAIAEAQGFAPDWGRAAGDWVKNLSSERTRRAYLEAWRGFMAFAGVSPEQVTQSEVIDYKVFLKTSTSPITGRPLSQSTVNQRLSALSSFYRFAADRGLVEKNPVDGVKRESVNPYGKATWLNPKEGEDLHLLAQVDTSTPQGLRDKAILLFFLTGAFRVAEVARLRIGDLRRQGDRLFVTYRRKGGEIEEVPVAAEAATALDRYLSTREGLKPKSPVFIATDKGRRLAARLDRYDEDEEKPLTPRSIRYMVKTYCDKAFGKGHGIHPHSLRHTAAKVAEVEGRTLTEIGRLLKHASTAVTTIYLHATADTDEETARIMGRRYATA